MVSAGSWTNVAAVINPAAGVMQIYVNGVLVVSRRPPTKALVPDTAPLPGH